MMLPEMQPISQEVTPLDGGLDQVTSSYNLQPGALRDTVNFACKPQGGYYRIPGYERFDGQPEPHSAQFTTVAITLNPSKVIAVGDAGTFGTLTGTVCYVDPFGLYVAITKVTGTPFVAGDIIIGGLTIGSATDLYTQLDLQKLAIIKAAAANIYRGDITAVPGSGPILGVVMYQDTVYAFRNNAGGTECDIHKSTLVGWVKVDLGYTISFDGLTVLPPESSGVGSFTITQGGVTGVGTRFNIEGSTGTGAAERWYGTMILSAETGGSLAAGAFTVATGAIAGATGNLLTATTAITILPDGHYSFTEAAFAAYENGERIIFGADNVNPAFEFDGITYVPLVIPSVTIPPKFIQVHANHLFVTVGSSLMHSAIGNPYSWDVLDGAGEISTGGDITGMILLPGSQGSQALGVFARHSTWILYGTSSADWNFTNYNLGVGAWEYTTQNMFDVFGLDDRGVTMLKQSLNYGNFDAATLTYNIQDFINSHRGGATCSALSRENNQYRVYFSGGYGLYITVTPQKVMGHGIVLFPNVPLVYWDGSLETTGESFSLFGDADGFIYRNDVGTSFDGAKILAYFNTNINSAKSPRIRKRFRRCVLEMHGSSYVDLDVGYMFEWSSPKILPHEFETGNIEFSNLSFWDNFIWDSFFWDGRTHDAVSVELNGTGENLQLMIISNVDYTEEFTISSAIFQFSPRRINR